MDIPTLLTKLAQHDLHYSEQEEAYQALVRLTQSIQIAKDRIIGPGGVMSALYEVNR